MLVDFRNKKTAVIIPETPTNEDELRNYLKLKLDCPLPIREGEKYCRLKPQLFKMWKEFACNKQINFEAGYIFDDDEERDFQLSEDGYDELKPAAISLSTWIDKAREDFITKCKPITVVVADSSVYAKHYLQKNISQDDICKLAKANNISYFLPRVTVETICIFRPS